MTQCIINCSVRILDKMLTAKVFMKMPEAIQGVVVSKAGTVIVELGPDLVNPKRWSGEGTIATAPGEDVQVVGKMASGDVVAGVMLMEDPYGTGLRGEFNLGFSV